MIFNFLSLLNVKKMSNLQIAIALVALYLIFMRKPKKEGFISMHDHRENALYRDM